ncbi:MAG: hemolysin III family protein [Cyanobacteria bacterium P01_A01_bin.3]
MDIIDTFSIPGFREPVSCLTHLLAVPIFTKLGYDLVRRSKHWGHALSLATMVICTIFLLSMSGVYHLLGPGSGRAVMRQLDIAGVFALIAGTVTPVHSILFRGYSRWIPLIWIWSAAATGITLRTIFSNSLPPEVALAIFLVMGWGELGTCFALKKRYGYWFIRPLLWGGFAYTLGGIVLSLDWPTIIPGVVGAHELWHLAVLIGLSQHWKFVFCFAGGEPERLIPVAKKI